MRLIPFVLAALLAVPLSASAQTMPSAGGVPAGPAAKEDDYARLVSRSVSGYIVPAYQALAETTGKLATAVGDYCAAPDATGRDALGNAFAATLVAWAGVDFLHFGPMGSEGRYERFAYWPDVHGTGARQLRQFLASEDTALVAPGALATKSAAVQGLPALEQLLYPGAKALLNDASPDRFRCALAGAVAGNMDAIAKDAVAGWAGDSGWDTLIEKPSDDNPVYRTHAEAATEILKAILTGLEQMRDQRLAPAVGATPADAKASLAPYYRSGQTIAYLEASSAALQRFVDVSGMLDLLPDDQKDYASSARFEFGNLDAALAAAGPDITAALADPLRRSKLNYADIVLASLRDLFQRHIAVAAGLSPGFNSLDGD